VKLRIRDHLEAGERKKRLISRPGDQKRDVEDPEKGKKTGQSKPERGGPINWGNREGEK